MSTVWLKIFNKKAGLNQSGFSLEESSF